MILLPSFWYDFCLYRVILFNNVTIFDIHRTCQDQQIINKVNTLISHADIIENEGDV